MTKVSKETGVITVLIERFERQRLPRILVIKNKVDKGELPTDLDIAFLEDIVSDATRNMPLIDKHPEWQRLCASVIHLYKEITEKALENEKYKL